MVSNTDPRFQGKVLLVEVTGSWCPNCHDEAPFLAELYRKYKGRGLEIVSLSFEEADQLKDPTRLRAFVKKYGLEFPVLLGGDPDEAAAKLTAGDGFEDRFAHDHSSMPAHHDGRLVPKHLGEGPAWL
jgi:thiol-disulfide isomerase/thioredoxin